MGIEAGGGEQAGAQVRLGSGSCRAPKAAGAAVRVGGGTLGESSPRLTPSSRVLRKDMGLKGEMTNQKCQQGIWLMAELPQKMHLKDSLFLLPGGAPEGTKLLPVQDCSGLGWKTMELSEVG